MLEHRHQAYLARRKEEREEGEIRRKGKKLVASIFWLKIFWQGVRAIEIQTVFKATINCGYSKFSEGAAKLLKIAPTNNASMTQATFFSLPYSGISPSSLSLINTQNGVVYILFGTVIHSRGTVLEQCN